MDPTQAVTLLLACRSLRDVSHPRLMHSQQLTCKWCQHKDESVDLSGHWSQPATEPYPKGIVQALSGCAHDL